MSIVVGKMEFHNRMDVEKALIAGQISKKVAVKLFDRYESIKTGAHVQTITLGTITGMSPVISGHEMYQMMYGAQVAPNQNKEKETTMLDSQVSPEQAARKHLLRRLSDAKDEKKLALRQQYGLDDEKAPKSPKEFLERIKAGKFVVPGAEDEKHPRYWDSYNAIRWRDPAVKEDQEGYDLAKVVLSKAARDVEDAIVVKTPEEGLKALQGFEKAK